MNRHVTLLVAVGSLLLGRPSLAQTGSAQDQEVDRLAVQLANPEVAAANIAAVRLGKLGPSAIKAKPSLLTALGHPEPLVAFNAACALYAVDPTEVAKVTAAVNRAIKGGDGLLRVSAIKFAREKLASSRPEVVPALAEALHDNGALVRNEAAQALGRVAGAGESDAVAALVKALDDGDCGVRAEAVRALSRFKSQAATILPALQAARESEELAASTFANEEARVEAEACSAPVFSALDDAERKLGGAAPAAAGPSKPPASGTVTTAQEITHEAAIKAAKEAFEKAHKNAPWLAHRFDKVEVVNQLGPEYVVQLVVVAKVKASLLNRKPHLETATMCIPVRVKDGRPEAFYDGTDMYRSFFECNKPEMMCDNLGMAARMYASRKGFFQLPPEVEQEYLTLCHKEGFIHAGGEPWRLRLITSAELEAFSEQARKQQAHGNPKVDAEPPSDVPKGSPASSQAAEGPAGERPQTQAEMNAKATQDFKKADDRLNAVWKRLMAVVSGERRNQLVSEERAWVKQRDATCDAEEASSLGGSIYPVIRTTCLTRMTNQRTAELEALVTKP